MSEPTRDAAWWGREVDRLAGEIQTRYNVPDGPMEQLMRAMMLAAGTKPQGEPPIGRNVEAIAALMAEYAKELRLREPSRVDVLSGVLVVQPTPWEIATFLAARGVLAVDSLSDEQANTLDSVDHPGSDSDEVRSILTRIARGEQP